MAPRGHQYNNACLCTRYSVAAASVMHLWVKIDTTVSILNTVIVRCKQITLILKDDKNIF